MKKILIILLALAICFSGCWNVEIVDPREETVSLEKEPETEEISKDFIEKIILDFGAVKNEDGTFISDKTSGFLFENIFEDASQLETKYYFFWATEKFTQKYNGDLTQFESPHGIGYSFPAEEFEEIIETYFGTTPEKLREDGIFYCSEHDAYCSPGATGFGAQYDVEILSHTKNGNELSIRLSVENNILCLKVLLTENGGYRFLSYLSEKGKWGPEKVYFRFDEADEPNTLSVGDYFGEWKLENLEVDYDEAGSSMIDSIDADFSGNLTMAGYIELSPLSVPFYEFIPSEYDLSRIPGAVAGGFKEKFSHFGLKIPEGLENSPNLDHGETLPCIIKVSGYHLSRAYTEGVDSFDVVEIKPIGSKVELSPLQKEIILNFGAREAEFGTIRSNKTTSLYFNTEGFSDGTKLNETSYFSWVMFYLGKEYDYETQKELFGEAGEGMGWAFPSEYYEPAVYKYFGVPAEELRKSEIYNPEKDYYNIPFGGGIGDYPYIVVNSIDETEEKVVFHITLVHIIEKNIDMALTVKLIPEGGYNYVSYLPE
ncbi:MAG: hypothetical protein IJZ58_00865 [Oscillospiraceae bacterium]|nr:hypothetical protein [Oscillospiraceae bacterium]